MDARSIARALNGRKSGAGWIVPCPAHEDRNPSLSLSDASNGHVLIHCHAGCSQKAVIQALKDLGLWPERTTQHHHGRVVAVYDYPDESGSLAYQVLRYEPKSFSQRYLDERGRWIDRKSPRQFLYQLPRVLRAPIVIVVEGEKDCDRLREAGFVATTNAGGANAPWLPEYTAALKGKEVILIPDNDLSGRKRVQRIARSLVGSARITYLELEGCKDVSEWFDKGHSELELIHQIES
jgi:putative DNA primase/helicase